MWSLPAVPATQEAEKRWKLEPRFDGSLGHTMRPPSRRGGRGESERGVCVWMWSCEGLSSLHCKSLNTSQHSPVPRVPGTASQAWEGKREREKRASSSGRTSFRLTHHHPVALAEKRGLQVASVAAIPTVLWATRRRERPHPSLRTSESESGEIRSLF